MTHVDDVHFNLRTPHDTTRLNLRMHHHHTALCRVSLITSLADVISRRIMAYVGEVDWWGASVAWFMKCHRRRSILKF